MTYDFTTSYRIGIAAASNAARNNADIDLVIADLSEQISLETEGKLLIRSAVFHEVGGQVTRTPSDVARRFAETFEAVFVAPATPGGSPEYLLAEIDRGPAGYPCAVKYGGDHYLCFEDLSLARALGDMVGSPSSGQKFLALLNPEDHISTTTLDGRRP